MEPSKKKEQHHLFAKHQKKRNIKIVNKAQEWIDCCSFSLSFDEKFFGPSLAKLVMHRSPLFQVVGAQA